MGELSTSDLIDKIIQAACNVRHELMHGYLETVYQNAMCIELRAMGLSVQPEVPLKIRYKNEVVGEYRADLLVENRVIVELKAVNTLLTVHEAQLVNYLTATGYDDGILINFGTETIQFKRKFRVYTPRRKK